MGLVDRLLGREEHTDKRSPRDVLAAAEQGRAATPDEMALERYRYMIRTAPPETVEQAHAEAFSKLTPDQRRLVLRELAQASPPSERAAVESTSSEDPAALARVATRAEVRQPGTMERLLGGGAAGSGMSFGANLLSSFAMGFVGSMVAQSFFSAMNFGGSYAALDDAEAGREDDHPEGNDAGADIDSGDDLASEDDFGSDDFGFDA
ncbi:MAG TPA: hypothetical protein VFQ61_02115 [Polyangiaceae bacterium]|nr:hypothetical protein [Polyangiaceae bacterium]